MVNHDNNLFKQYTPKENKHFQSELQSNGKAKAHLEAPDYMGKGIKDYKIKPKHHISRKLLAILISIGVVIVALVVVGATASYHRDAPSTTSPNSVQQAKPKQNKKIKKKQTHKITRKHIAPKKTKSHDNIIQVTNNQAKVVPKSSMDKSKKSKNSSIKPVKPNNIKKTINNHNNTKAINKSSTTTSQKNSTSSNSQKTSTKSQQ